MWTGPNIVIPLGVTLVLLLWTTLPAEAKQPHIVFVLADDYGFNDVGYHGSEIKTPNLDELSSQGVRLENYYVQPSCSPSRSQFMSGRYQIRTGLQHEIIWSTQANALPLDSPTIADKLRQSGYATHMVGKWHLGFYMDKFLPINRGWDTFYGYYTGSQDYYTHKLSGFWHAPEYLDFHDQDKPVYNETGHYSTHLFTDKAIQRIKDHDKSKPLFLYLAYQAVHAPMEVPEEYKKPYGFIPDDRRRIYAGMTTCMDEGVGNLTRALKEQGMWDDTVFVFSTDNGAIPLGGGNNYPLRGYKGAYFEGGVRGVGFVHAAHLETAGTVNRDLMHISDWFPTFVRLAGGSLNDTKPLDGHDQWDTLSKGVPTSRTELLHNIDPRVTWRGNRTYSDTFDHRIQAALRVGDWKLLTGIPGYRGWTPAPVHSQGASENFHPSVSEAQDKNLWLFNISADPSEQFDLSRDHPEVVKELLDKLAAYYVTAEPVRFPVRHDPRLNLQKLGGVWGPWVGVKGLEFVSSLFFFVPVNAAPAPCCLAVSSLLACLCWAVFAWVK